MPGAVAEVRDEAGVRDRLVTALRGLGGRATVGDVVAATGLARERVEQSLRSLLESCRGHLAVSDQGDLLYAFDPELIRRDHVSWWGRFKRSAKRFLASAFKVWIVVMLVVYFVVFVALAVAAIVAVLSRDGNNRGSSRRRGGGVRIPGFWIWYLFWRPNWRYGQPYYGRRWEQRHGGDGVPFYKKVFAFVFGPDEPHPTQEQRDREVIRLIRSRAGVLTVAELMGHNGSTVAAAQDEMARLVGAYAGDVRVSTSGELVYIFPELMLSAHGRVSAREPEPAWRRLEYARSVTGNQTGTNALIAGLNGFNLFAAASSPWLIFPRLGIGGPLADVGLVWIPLVFSATFFAIPLVRRVSLARENGRRRRRNVRKVLLGRIYQASLGDGSWIDAESAREHLRKALSSGSADAAPTAAEVARELQRLVVEFDAAVEPGPSGAPRFRFPAVRSQFEAAEELRRNLALEKQEMGRIVYSSADTPEEAGRRELADFDRALQKYVPTPDRVGYVDDFEVVEFDMLRPSLTSAAHGR